MKKMVVFNVGGGLCSYIEVDGISVLVDVGKSSTFNPVTDFLLPYYTKTGKAQSEKDGNKFVMDQLIISHPHNDHISAIADYSENFEAGYITCPNDRNSAEYTYLNIDWDLFFPDGGINSNDNAKVLRDMYAERKPPLETVIKGTNGLDKQYLYFLPPQMVSDTEELHSNGETYANNISLVTMFTINGTHVLFPGDIMKEGMGYLLKNTNLAKGVQAGIDILIAPHHGLRSAFSTELFQNMPNGRTKCLNIISEKMNNIAENREVDCRYASEEYCSGINNLGTFQSLARQRKTSNGHICVDFRCEKEPEFFITNNSDDLLEWFMY